MECFEEGKKYILYIYIYNEKEEKKKKKKKRSEAGKETKDEVLSRSDQSLCLTLNLLAPLPSPPSLSQYLQNNISSPFIIHHHLCETL